MKFIELHANPQEVPTKKEDYFENIGTPNERVRGNPGGVSSDWQMDPTLVLECPVCHEQSEHEAPAGWWSMWSWGLEGKKRLEEHLKWMLQVTGQYRCPHCGVVSYFDDNSLDQLHKLVELAVGNMPDEGADWARQCFDRFMTFHNWGHPAYQYRNEPDDGRDITSNLWLKTVCGTCDFCKRALERSSKAWGRSRGY